jgi:hypothetical protein
MDRRKTPHLDRPKLPSPEVTAKTPARIRDGKGRTIAPPRVFYRGTNPGDERRISTGDAHWDAHLFLTSDYDSATFYGKVIATYDAKSEARIVYEGTRAFATLARGLTGSLLATSSEIAKRAASAGYDAVWFIRQGDVGTAIINRDKFILRESKNGG